MADIERSRAVVGTGETYDGRIAPQIKAELTRPVRVREGATVLGSVYGETVDIETAATVDGSVMAKESVEASGGTVAGDVGTPGSVVCEGTRVDGTVSGTRIRLVDCVVLGNVVGTEIVLEDSIVVGLVGADRHLTIEDSLCYTFRSTGETTLDGARLVLPQAIADGAVTFGSPVAVVGVADNSSTDEASLPSMTAADLCDRDGTTYLTLAPRLLNVDRVAERLETLETRLAEIVEGAMTAEETVDVDAVVETLTVQSGTSAD